MCGILGLLLHDPTINAAPEICEGLSLLQHRGQDACGIVTGGPRGRLYQCKANGMVRDVFTQEALARLVGGMGIGHGKLLSNSYSCPDNERSTLCAASFCLCSLMGLHNSQSPAFPHSNADVMTQFSPLSNGRQFAPCGGSAVLRQFAVWYYFCPCKICRICLPGPELLTSHRTEI